MIFVRHGQSEFNVVYSETRIDPGIEDPGITALGESQAIEAANHLANLGVSRLISSPYRRALQTATIIAEALNLSISVDPLVREHYAFSCDVGSPRSVLAEAWPRIDFSHIDEKWWPDQDETEDLVAARGSLFLDKTIGLHDRDSVAVVSHWGFIRGMTGLRVTNGSIVRVDKSGRGMVVGPSNP
jgi:broad specificity phosphatase PhoE